MTKKLHYILLTLLLTSSYSFSQGLGTIKGTVSDEDSKTPVWNARITVTKDGVKKGEARTDYDGKFQIDALSPGQYDVSFENKTDGYVPGLRTGVTVSADKYQFLNDLYLSKASDVTELEEVKVTAYKEKLIDPEGVSGGTLGREQIAALPIRSAAEATAAVAGVNRSESDGGISIKGARTSDSYFYIDGIKVRGSSNLPKGALEEVQVITGGLPANYGDVTGGIISITTRGPSANYFGSVEAVSSGVYINGDDPDGYDGKVIGFDQFGYNLFEGLLSGPLLMKKDTTGEKTIPIIGFLVSANYTDRLDGRPLADGSYRIKKEVRDELLANPLRPTATGFGTFHNANFLSMDDFERSAWRMNARSRVFFCTRKNRC
jgi:hypothetical protein